MADTSEGLQFSYRGKEYRFINETKQNLDTFVCPVCIEIVSEPFQTSCGHLFCKKCISALKKCPVCRTDCDSHPDHFNNRKIRSLNVLCMNSAKGCEWSGELGYVEGHMASCPCQVIKCPHCEFRDRPEVVTTDHFTTCEEYPFPCPNGCGIGVVRRKQMAEHLEICTKQEIRCVYQSLGCKAVLPRDEMEPHVSSNVEAHSRLTLDRVVELSALVSEMCALLTNHGLPVPSITSKSAAKPWLENKQPMKQPVLPWVTKMEGFHSKKEKREEWFSEAVYSHFGGYKMCLSMDASGWGPGDSSHISIYICLVAGEYDNQLKWPFNGGISVTLLNQLEDDGHFVETVWPCDVEDVPETVSGRVTAGVVAGGGWGLHQFITVEGLGCPGNSSCEYLRDDTLFFRIERTK